MSWLRELPRIGQRLWRSRQNKAQGKRSEGPRSPGYKSQIISEALKERQKNPLEQTLFCRPFGALCYSFHLFPGLRGLFRPLTPGFDLQPFQGCLSSGFATAPMITVKWLTWFPYPAGEIPIFVCILPAFSSHHPALFSVFRSVPLSILILILLHQATHSASSIQREVTQTLPMTMQQYAVKWKW